MTTPMIDRVLRHDNPPSLLGYLLMDDRTTLVTELRALLADRDTWRSLANANEAERDRWKAKAEDRQIEVTQLRTELQSIKDVKPRPVREYKGVTYRDAAWYTPDGKRYEMASGVVWNKSVTLSLTDLDIPALLALRDDPWEKGETVEEVVQAWWRSQNCYEIRTADLCARLRVHLSQQMPKTLYHIHADGTVEPVRTELTAGEHIAALVAMGATTANVCRGSAIANRDMKILILPPEVSP